MLGYAEDHFHETYRIYNLKTHKIILSRDVKWDDWTKPTPSKDVDLFDNPPGMDTEEEDSDEEQEEQRDNTLRPAVISDDKREEPEVGRMEFGEIGQGATTKEQQQSPQDRVAHEEQEQDKEPVVEEDPQQKKMASNEVVKVRKTTA